MNRRLAATLTATGLLATAVACSSSTGNYVAGPPSSTPAATSTSPGANTIGVGQTATFQSQFLGEQGTTIRLTVTKIAYVSSVMDLGTPQPPTRGVLVRVTMTATNVGNNPGQFDYANFQWVSPTGEVIPNPDTAGGATDAMPTVTMQPGQHVTGVATFDISAKGGQLQYANASSQPPLVTINLPLS